ncbi:hypothetical protein E4U41_003031 [Claviceps citrina]|nr:hypothetical protein E4U41_003031 [Claviceps citrina]
MALEHAHTIRITGRGDLDPDPIFEKFRRYVASQNLSYQCIDESAFNVVYMFVRPVPAGTNDFECPDLEIACDYLLEQGLVGSCVGNEFHFVNLGDSGEDESTLPEKKRRKLNE